MTSDPVKHILSQFGKRQMTTTQSLAERLEEYRDRGNLAELGGIVLDNLPTILSALRSRDSVIEDCARIAEAVNSEHGGEIYIAAQIAKDIRSLSSHAETAGMVSVPVEPTEAILDAFWHQAGESKEMRPRVHARARHYWRAMIKAAKGGEK